MSNKKPDKKKPTYEQEILLLADIYEILEKIEEHLRP